MRQVSKRGIPVRVNSSGVGSIVIPQDIDRKTFITDCIRKGTVSILTDTWRYDNVKVVKSVFNDIIFPEKYDLLGSTVVWVSIPKFNQLVIVGVLNKYNEVVTGDENEVSLKRVTKNGVVEIKEKGDTGELFITVSSQKSNSGNIYINAVGNNSNGGKLFINTNNEVNIKTENKINVETIEELNLIVKKENSSTQMKVTNSHYNIVANNYSIKDLLYDIIDEVSNSTVATALGTQPLLNKIQLIQLKEKVDKILN